MSVLKVLTWPNQVLETKADSVIEFNDEFQQFVADMHETMQDARGIGLAANQVGVLKQVLTIQINYSEPDPEDEPEDIEERRWWHDKAFTFCNPKIVKTKGKIKYQEGCLSFPEIYEFVDRHAEVWVQAQDEAGKDFEVHATELFAVCLQHEIDHLNGVVFVNRMSRLKSSMIKKKLMRRGRPEAEIPV